MSYTNEQLQTLQEALVRGERRVSFADKTVEYRSVDELKEAIRLVKASLAQQAAQTTLVPPPARQVRLHTGKGF